MKKTSRIDSSSKSDYPKTSRYKTYAPTEKKDDSLSLVKAIEETVLTSLTDEKADNDYKFEPNNFISTKTSVVIDEQNKINTEKFLEIFKMNTNEFKYAERHSIGKKFVSQKLI